MLRKGYQKMSLLLLVLVFASQGASAQVTYLGAQFYDNLYLGNPAMAGIDEGVILDLSYRNQWRTMPGSPVTQSFTAEYGKGKVGAGLNVYNDKAGAYGRLRVVGSYAYHLPLDDDTKRLHFGVSMGVSNTKLDRSKIHGDDGDFLVDGFREKPYLVGDFGMAYQSDKWTFQAALPNMKKYFEKDERKTIDRATFLVSMSYRLALQMEGVYMEPRLGFRGASGLGNIMDFGTNITFQDNLLTAMGIYHSNKSFTLGFGVNLEERYQIKGYYTSQLTDVSSSFGGNFEIGIRANVFNKKASF